jgi:hypothetical protein
MPQISLENARKVRREITSSNIPTMTERLGGRLRHSEQLVKRLFEWQSTLDRRTYVKTQPYSEAMVREYNQYKAESKTVGPARKSYSNYRNSVPYNAETTEQGYQLALLALEWGRRAVR